MAQPSPLTVADGCFGAATPQTSIDHCWVTGGISAIPPVTSTVGALYLPCDRALPRGLIGRTNPFISKAHLPKSGGPCGDHLSGPISNSVVAYLVHPRRLGARNTIPCQINTQNRRGASLSHSQVVDLLNSSQNYCIIYAPRSGGGNGQARELGRQKERRLGEMKVFPPVRYSRMH
jgi:hypothetical protein